jgi:hypothetical protein
MVQPGAINYLLISTSTPGDLFSGSFVGSHREQGFPVVSHRSGGLASRRMQVPPTLGDDDKIILPGGG